MSTYGRITKTNLEDLDWIRGWNCMEPSMAGTQFGLELAQLAYDFQTEPWISAGWTDIAIQVDRRLLSGISAPEEGGDWRTMVINGLVPRVARRLRMMSNPITQVRGLKNESLLYDTGKAITLLKPLPGGRFAVAIGFSGTGRRPQDWVSNTRFGHPDKLHAGFEYLSELYHGNAEEILFPTAAKALKKESLSLRDVIAECHREDSRFTLVLSGHSQGAAVLQVWTYKRLQEGMKEPNIKGMGFACPMVASGMDASQRACPLALFVNTDDIFTRVGLREHLGRVWAFTPDAAFRRQSYGKAWEDPFIREMLGILNHVRDIDQALITMLGFLEALETVPRKEAGVALAHFIHAIMAPKWLPLAEDTVAKILRFLRMSMRRYYIDLNGQALQDEAVRESMILSQRLLVRHSAPDITAAFLSTLTLTHSLCGQTPGQEDLAPYCYMATRAFGTLELAMEQAI